MASSGGEVSRAGEECPDGFGCARRRTGNLLLYALGHVLAAEEELQHVRVLIEHSKKHVDALTDAVVGRGAFEGEAVDALPKHFANLLDHGDVEVLFGAEMLVQHGLCDAGGLGDVVHRRGMVAALTEF
ncbi:hypothetical protein [Dermabacter hominis]